MNYSVIFRLPLHLWLALAFPSPEHSFVSVEGLVILICVCLLQDLLLGFLFHFSDGGVGGLVCLAGNYSLGLTCF